MYIVTIHVYKKHNVIDEVFVIHDNVQAGTLFFHKPKLEFEAKQTTLCIDIVNHKLTLR